MVDGAGQSRRRLVAFAGIMVSGTLLVCLTLAELAVRVTRPQSDLRRRDLFFQYEPFIGSEGLPDKTGVFANSSFKTTVTHNAQGFRDGEHEQANTGQKFRILTLGDSFTWGHGVDDDEVYMKVLEALDDRIETINMGGPGGDPPSELKVYLSRALAYEHDVVALGLFLGNDIIATHPTPDSSPPQFGFDDEGHFALIGRRLPPERVAAIRRQSEESYSSTKRRGFWSRIHYGLIRHLQLMTLFDNSRDYYSEVIKGSVPYNRILRLMGKENHRAFPFLRYCMSEDPEEVTQGWRLLREVLRRLEREAAQVSARVYILFIPDAVQVSQTLYERTLRRYGYEPSEFDVERPNRKLAALCEELDLACLDLLPTLREAAARGEKLYYRRDPHWTPAGHRIAAEQMHQDLLRRRWLD